MLTLFNPTNEVFKMTFAGRDIILNPDNKLQVDDNAGNHLLNAYGRRGLCQLVFGDDEGKVGQAGRVRNVEFKKDQITNYNIQNEQRKMGGLGYLKPTPTVQRYALELGISLLEPYTLKDMEKGEIASLMRENQELKKRIEEVMKMVVGMVESQAGAHSPTVSEPGEGPPPKGKGK